MPTEHQGISTHGGSYTAGNVNTNGGDFIGRDQINHYYQAISTRRNYRSDIAGILSYYTAIFVGRDAEWQQLAAFAGQANAGYYLLQASPGYGKSALMAHLVHRHERGHWAQSAKPDLLYFFIRQEGERNKPKAFLEALNSQLLDLLAAEGGVPSDLPTLQIQFSQLWAVAVATASAQKPLLLLVDGLDEMAQGETTIADELPTNLPPYVHVIVSSRDKPDPLERVALEHPLRRALSLHLQTLSATEVHTLLLESGAPTATAAQLAPRVLTMTKGEPLFARFVSQEVATSGEAALAALEQDPPAGVEQYFQRQFKQLDQVAQGDLAWAILGLLVVAIGGLTPDEMADVLAVSKRNVRKALASIQRFLLGEERLELMHLQLRNVVAAEFPVKEQNAYRHTLLTWCQQYEAQHWPPETPIYVLRSYVNLLKTTGQTAQLYTVILDAAFRQAQIDQLEDASTTLENLALALALALDSDDFVKILSCVAAYRDTMRSQGFAQAIFEAVDHGDLKRALKLADFYSGARDWPRVLYLYLAWEAALASKTDLCFQIVTAAERLAVVEAQELCEAFLVYIARALTPGDTAAALTTLRKFAPGADSTVLWRGYPLAQPPTEEAVQETRLALDTELARLEQLAQQGDAEAISMLPFLEELARDTWIYSKDLRGRLFQVAAHPSGLGYIERTLNLVLPNPYPRYRDIALVVLGIVTVLTPNDEEWMKGWQRQILRRLLSVALDWEGVTFTFDLPFLLLHEAQKRGLPDRLDLPFYCDRALHSVDRWGTALRASSAQAAAYFLQPERQEQTLQMLGEAPNRARGFAGYAVSHLCSIANRWLEWGQPAQITRPRAEYGQPSLLALIQQQADYVRDEGFRRDCQQLVETYRAWLQQATPATEAGLMLVAATPDAATRFALIEHLSARWAWPAAHPNWAGLKALVSRALLDGTALDAVLARLVRLYLSHPQFHVNDAALNDALRICSTALMSGRPWERTYFIQIG